jgi:hypothetical protein
MTEYSLTNPIACTPVAPFAGYNTTAWPVDQDSGATPNAGKWTKLYLMSAPPFVCGLLRSDLAA